MSEYLRVKLKDVTSSIQTGPFGSQLHRSDYSNNGVPVVMPVNLINDSISEKGIARVSQEHVERLARHKASIGDIMYARRGDVGRCARVTQKEEGWLCGTGCLRVTPNEASINSDYLYYALSSDKIVRWVQNHAVGATMPNLNTGILESIPLTIPERKADQARIAGILSTYDKLIENNRKQIKLLEEAAQRLYKEWFVDLKFPGHETTPIDPTTNLPEGWRKGTLADIVEFKRGKIITAAKAKEGSVPVVAGGLGPAYFHNQGNTTAPVVTVSGSGANAGFTRLYMQDIWASDCSYVDSTMVDCLYYVYESVVNIGHGFQHLQRGSAQPHVYPSHINSTTLVLPPDEIRQLFCQVVAPPFEQCAVAERVVLNAQEARDRLLPKLMSGEIEV